MALETGSFISDLNASNPQSTDSVAQADDHLRLLKATIKATFPNITGAVTKTHTQLNNTVDKGGDTMTGPLTLSGAPSSNLHAATKLYVDTSASDKVVSTRTISAGTGLTGGGDLSANRTISVAAGGISATELASNAVTTIKINDGAVTPAKLSQKLTADTAQGTTSGNTKDFTGIPSWVKRITIQFLAVSLNAAGIIRVQLGDSGGLEATGYGGTSALVGFHTYSITNGIGIDVNSSTLFFSGQMIIENITGNYWIASHTLGAGGGYVVVGGAYKELSGTLDRLQIAATDTAGATSGAISFDAGAINIFYE